MFKDSVSDCITKETRAMRPIIGLHFQIQMSLLDLFLGYT